MRRSVLAAGVALGTGVFAAPMSAWAASVLRLSAADVVAARRLFTTGAYTRLGEVLPLLLAAAAHSIEQAQPAPPRPTGPPSRGAITTAAPAALGASAFEGLNESAACEASAARTLVPDRYQQAVRHGTYDFGGHRGDESPLAYDRRGLRVVQVSRRRRRRPPP